MKLIQDIIPFRRQTFDVPKTVYDTVDASKLPTETMITELHSRGVTIERIFAQYYAEEAAGDFTANLTVNDAELAGQVPKTPKAF